jgi:hypothetical protein
MLVHASPTPQEEHTGKERGALMRGMEARHDPRVIVPIGFCGDTMR